jgi:outer membrane protein OmpA-like peptidoglycan-associated protein
MNPHSLLLILCRYMWAAAVAATLVGCASTPPPAASAAPATPPPRAERLAALGFEKTDEGYVLNLPGPLLFDSGSDVLSEGAKGVLSKLAQDLIALEIRKLRLFGHTDNVGGVEFNRSLSSRRADAVARFMAANGFRDESLERRGFGFDRPLAGNETPEGRAKNRRVAVIVPFE